MPPVKISPIHATASPPPRYPKEEPEPPPSAEKGNAVLLNRMRAAVLTHYRTSPSAPHRPIDLTHVHEEPFVSLMTNGSAKNDGDGGSVTQQATQETEDDEEEDYVPPSLADYVATVSRALEEQQMEFLNSTSRSETRDEQNDPDTIVPPSTSFQINDALSHQRRRSSSDGLAQLWSPESCFRSPPPLNPASLLTDTQLQKQALSSSFSFSHGDPPLLRSLPPLSLTSVKRKVEDPPADSPPRHLNVEVIVEPMETAPSNTNTMPASPGQRSSAGQEVVIRDEEEEAAASTLDDSYNADSDVLPEQKDLMHLLSTIATDHDLSATDALKILRISTTTEEEVAIPSSARNHFKEGQHPPATSRTVEPSPIAALLTRTSNAPTARTKSALRTNPSDEDTESRQLMAGSSLSTDTNRIPSPPKRMFTNRPPTSPKSLTTPSPRYSDAKRTVPSAASSSNDRQRPLPTPISTHEPPKPLNTTVSTPSPLSMSSANQKAFGGRGGAFQPSISATSTISSIPTSPVPRFHSPPSSPRVKTAPRFTAETAERLSRPNKTPPPHYASPLKKNANQQSNRVSSRSANSKNPLVSPQPRGSTMSVVKHTPIASMNRQSESPAAFKGSEQRLSSPQKATQSSNAQPSSLRTLRPASIDARVTDTTPTRRRSMERLVRHSKVLKNGRMSPFNGPLVVTTAPLAHPSVPKTETVSPSKRDSPLNSYKLSIGFELSSRLSPAHKLAPSPTPLHSEEDVIERLSRPTVARKTAIECTLNPPPPREEEVELPPRPPSPYVFTAETADRLNQPTAARSAAIHATIVPSPAQHRRSNSGSVCGGGSVSSRDGGYDSCGERHLPPPLDPSSHLLHNTAVSDAKKTTPKKVIVRLPPPKKYVSGASDRLMTRTVANRALVTGRKEPDPMEKSKRKPTTPEKPKFTVEDGIAKAKERVRQRQLLKKQEEQRKGLPPMHPSMHTPNNAAHRPLVAKRPLTVPCGPRVASIRSTKDRQSQREDPTLAQRLDIFGKGLRDDFSVGSQGSSFSRRSLTIPTGPKLATDVRGGEKYVPPKSRSDVSLAQSTDLLQHGLRSPYHSTNSHRGLTIPISPKFAPVPARQRPKSTAELEAEEMEYFNSHRFKAKPPLGQRHSIGLARSGNSTVPGFMKPTAVSKLSQRQDRSVPVEPRRGASVASRSHSSSTHLSREVDPIVERADRLAKALALREEARQEKLAAEEAERQEQARFKAKPVPRTTYRYTPVVPAPSGPLVEPFSPELQTKQRVIERREFDFQAEQDRAARLAEIQAMEARRRAEEEEDLQERRRLPVSEGGLIPVAAPINAVLLQ